MRSLGLTGLETTETCFAGACDIVTPEAAVSEYTYRQYQGVMRHWNRVTRRGANHQNAIQAELYGLIAGDLGGFTLDAWEFCYAHTARELAKLMERLRDSGKRIVVDTVQRTCEVHSIAIKPLDNGQYRALGSGIPPSLSGKPITAEQIHPFLYESGYNVNPKRPFVGANIVGLPAPATRARVADIRPERGRK